MGKELFNFSEIISNLEKREDIYYVEFKSNKNSNFSILFLCNSKMLDGDCFFKITPSFSDLKCVTVEFIKKNVSFLSFSDKDELKMENLDEILKDLESYVFNLITNRYVFPYEIVEDEFLENNFSQFSFRASYQKSNGKNSNVTLVEI